MVFKLIIENEAQQEISKAIEWYKSKQTGLGVEFYNYLDGYFQTLKGGHIFLPSKGIRVFESFLLKNSLL